MTTRSFTSWRKLDIDSQSSVVRRSRINGRTTDDQRLPSIQQRRSRWGPAFGRKSRSSLIPDYARIRFRLRKHLIGSHMRRSRRQHLFFPVNQIARIETRQFKSMPMRDRIGRTSFHTIATKYTSIIVDVVDAGVAFGARNPFRRGVFRGFYVDAIRGASGGAEETGYTFFQAVFIALQDVHTAKALLKLCAFQRA